MEIRLIGPLQSNKAAEAVGFFDVIETVDREKIAKAIAAEIARPGRRPRLYLQVNTGEEAQKAGVAPAEAAAFVARCREVHKLEIEGLMCIPPAEEAPGPHFDRLAALAREAESKSSRWGCPATTKSPSRMGRRACASAARFLERGIMGKCWGRRLSQCERPHPSGFAETKSARPTWSPRKF